MKVVWLAEEWHKNKEEHCIRSAHGTKKGAEKVEPVNALLHEMHFTKVPFKN